MNIDHIPRTSKSSKFMKETPGEESVKSSSSDSSINIKAAIPNLVLAALYGLARFANVTLPGMSPRWLGTMMGIEFLVIHSFPFMVFFGMARPATPAARKVVRGFYWSLFVIYFLFAIQMGGLPGLLAFASLTAVTYLGFLMHRKPDAFSELLVRWMVSFLAFMVTAGIADVSSNVDDWPGERAALTFGMAYFALLAALESSGFYQSNVLRRIIEEHRKGKPL